MCGGSGEAAVRRRRWGRSPHASPRAGAAHRHGVENFDVALVQVCVKELDDLARRGEASQAGGGGGGQGMRAGTWRGRGCGASAPQRTLNPPPNLRRRKRCARALLLGVCKGGGRATDPPDAVVGGFAHAGLRGALGGLAHHRHEHVALRLAAEVGLAKGQAAVARTRPGADEKEEEGGGGA